MAEINYTQFVEPTLIEVLTKVQEYIKVFKIDNKRILNLVSYYSVDYGWVVTIYYREE